MNKKEFAIYPTSFGLMRIAHHDGAITSIKKLTEKTADMGVQTDLTDQAYAQLQEYFDGQRQTFDFPWVLHGTAFQQKVWSALCAIAYGETKSYQAIAKAVGNDKACRAVGAANHKNPLAIVVPCHRVIAANGKLAGYDGGVAMKAALIALEKKYAETQ